MRVMELIRDFFAVDNGNVRILSMGFVNQRDDGFIIGFCHCLCRRIADGAQLGNFSEGQA